MSADFPTRSIFSCALALAAILASPLAEGAAAESVRPAKSAICDEVACRGPVTVRLADDDGSVLEGTMPPGPYVLDGVINVLVGESFDVEAADTGDRFLTLRYVDKAAEPDRSLTVSLEQLVSADGNEMIFSLENRLARAVKFRLATNPPGSPELVYSRTCPVAPGDWGFEKWSGPIAQLVVFDVQALDPDDTRAAVCD